MNDVISWSYQRYSKISNQLSIVPKYTRIGELKSCSWFIKGKIFCITFVICMSQKVSENLFCMAYLGDLLNWYGYKLNKLKPLMFYCEILCKAVLGELAIDIWAFTPILKLTRHTAAHLLIIKEWWPPWAQIFRNHTLGRNLVTSPMFQSKHEEHREKALGFI